MDNEISFKLPIVRSTFICKNGLRRYNYVVVKYNTAYLLMMKVTPDDVEFVGRVYQQTVGIPMGTNCAPFVADLFLYSFQADFVQHLQKSKFKKQITSFNLTFHYIYDVLSLNNTKLNVALMLYIRRNFRLKTRQML